MNNPFNSNYLYIFIKKRSRFFWESLIITGLGLWVYVYSVEHDFFEGLVEFSRDHEDWELDELLTLLMISAFAMIAINYRNVTYLKLEIDRREKAEEKIQHMAFYDTLTDLPNRQLFNDRLVHVIAHAKRHNQICALLFIDLDNFKEVNDSYGHQQGDALLRQTTERLLGVLRADDTLSRLSGDEFVVLVEEIERPSVAGDIALKLVNSMKEDFILDGRHIQVSVSIGISVFPSDGDNAGLLLRNADTAMYYAKNAGKNAFKFFSKELDHQSHEKLSIRNELRSAISNNEFQIYYQPVIDVHSGEIKGAEALLRWHNKELGNVSPVTFIPIAEESGQIREIDQWVLRQVCKQSKKWQRDGYQFIRISINMSARDLWDDSYADRVKDLLEEVQLSPDYLELELTETSIMKDVDYALEKIQALSDLGLSIAVDDFGTGYCSLSYLKKFKLSRLKIDRSFIVDIPKNFEDIATVNAIISLASHLGMKITAEGVETKEQVAYLKSTKCDSIQGFYFYKPIPAQEFEKLLEKTRYSHSA